MDEKGNTGLEEERRLAHVGITRAKKYLFLSYAQNRRVYGNYTQSIPSRFLSEIAPEFIEEELIYDAYTQQYSSFPVSIMTKKLHKWSYSIREVAGHRTL